MRKIIHIDELTDICGFFNSETRVNNCYGCNHPDQESSDIDEDTGLRQGKCYSFSCPVATEADLQDLKELDAERYEEWKDEPYDPSDSGAELMIVDTETNPYA